MRRNAGEPLRPRTDDRRPKLGNPEGAIQIYVFEDLTCPFCRVASRATKQLFQCFPGQIGLSVRHLPMDFHPNSDLAARLFEALLHEAPERAWKFREALLHRVSTEPVSVEDLNELLRSVGADPVPVSARACSESTLTIVREDAEEAAALSLTGTPKFIVNGMLVPGAYPVEHFQDVISVWREETASSQLPKL